MKKLIIILCVLWMGFIFYNSSQNAEESNNKSNSIVENIVPSENNEDKVNDNLQMNLENEAINEDSLLNKNNLNILIRKSAHAFEFFVLSILVATAFYCNGISGKKAVIYTLLIVLVYAASDEVHQLYVQGRTGRVLDVLIDFIGGVIGIGIYQLIRKSTEFYRIEKGK